MRLCQITQSYDRWGNVLSVTDALGNTSSNAYNQNNQLLSTTSAQTDIWLDSFANGTLDAQTGEAKALRGSITQHNYYDKAGRLIATRDGNNNLRYSQYDTLGQKSADIQSDGIRTLYTYNLWGEQSSQTKQSADTQISYTSTVDYDLAGRIIRQRTLGISATQWKTEIYRYNSQGQRIEAQQRLTANGSERLITQQNYDGSNRVISDIKQSYQYSNGVRTLKQGVMDQGVWVANSGPNTLTRYDAAGRKVSESDGTGRR